MKIRGIDTFRCKEYLLKKLVNEEKTPSELAAELGVEEKIILFHLRKQELYKDKSFMHFLYIVKEKSTYDIESEYAICQKKAWRWLSKLGIQIRSTVEAAQVNSTLLSDTPYFKYLFFKILMEKEGYTLSNYTIGSGSQITIKCMACKVPVSRSICDFLKKCEPKWVSYLKENFNGIDFTGTLCHRCSKKQFRLCFPAHDFLVSKRDAQPVENFIGVDNFHFAGEDSWKNSLENSLELKRKLTLGSSTHITVLQGEFKCLNQEVHNIFRKQEENNWENLVSLARSARDKMINGEWLTPVLENKGYEEEKVQPLVELALERLGVYFTHEHEFQSSYFYKGKRKGEQSGGSRPDHVIFNTKPKAGDMPRLIIDSKTEKGYDKVVYAIRHSEKFTPREQFEKYSKDFPDTPQIIITLSRMAFVQANSMQGLCIIKQIDLSTDVSLSEWIQQVSDIIKNYMVPCDSIFEAAAE